MANACIYRMKLFYVYTLYWWRYMCCVVSTHHSTRCSARREWENKKEINKYTQWKIALTYYIETEIRQCSSHCSMVFFFCLLASFQISFWLSWICTPCSIQSVFGSMVHIHSNTVQWRGEPERASTHYFNTLFVFVFFIFFFHFIWLEPVSRLNISLLSSVCV